MSRNSDMKMTMDMPGAKTVEEGAKSLIRALQVQDIPKEEDKIFLTSWGEWWDPKKEYPLALDRNLQDKWSPSRAELEEEAGL